MGSDLRESYSRFRATPTTRRQVPCLRWEMGVLLALDRAILIANFFEGRSLDLLIDMNKVYFELQRTYDMLGSQRIHDDFLSKGLHPKVFWNDSDLTVTFGFLPWDILLVPPAIARPLHEHFEFYSIRLRVDSETPAYILDYPQQVKDYIVLDWRGEGYEIYPYGDAEVYQNPDRLKLSLHQMKDTGEPVLNMNHPRVINHEALFQRLTAFGFPDPLSPFGQIWDLNATVPGDDPLDDLLKDMFL